MAAGAVATALVCSVNVSSRMLEAASRNLPAPVFLPVVEELSSFVMVVALGFLVNVALQRAPLRSGQVGRFLLIHLALTIPYCLAHVAGMVALRHLAFASVGLDYQFGGQDLGLALFYEWRKDALTYAAWLALFWVGAELFRRAAPAVDLTHRIAFKDGARTYFIAPAEIIWVEAAGNYVEAHLKDRVVMTRATLAAMTTDLAPHGFVQVHRSRLVNRARIKALAPKPSGDVVLTMDDGRTLAASRRYRDALQV